MWWMSRLHFTGKNARMLYMLESDILKEGWSELKVWRIQKENNISVNVRALPASPSLLRKSDVVCSLSAGCHRVENDRWSVTLWTIFNFSEPMFRRPIWTGLGARQHKFSAISYSNRHRELSSEVRKQTLYLFMCHGMMSRAWFARGGAWSLISSDKVVLNLEGLV